MKISGIYKIQSLKKSKRCYIGSAMNIDKRWKEHLYSLRKNKHHSKKLQNHYNKYDESDLLFSVIIGCEKDELVMKEQFFIDVYNPYFNICQKARSCIGVKLSEETKLKISIANTGKKRSSEVKLKMSLARKGHKLGPKTEEHIRKIIETKKKNDCLKHSDEWKRKHSEKMKGSGNPMFGKHQSEESKKKNRESNLGIHDGEKNHFYGKHHSDETKKKMKDARVLINN